MKNVLICKNCSTENSFYKFICVKCSAILRERIVNIDLWHTLNLLIDTPGKAFSNIIRSEHKNFIFFLAFLIILKLFISSIIVSEQLFGQSASMLIIFLFSTIAIFLFFSVSAYILQVVLKMFKIDSRFSDDYSVLTYSFIPYIYALIFLFPIEITLFGGYLFSNNPSPFELKLIPAYILIGLELLMALWSIILLFSAAKTSSRNNIFSLIFAILIGAAFFSIPFLIAVITN